MYVFGSRNENYYSIFKNGKNENNTKVLATCFQKTFMKIGQF